MKRRYYFNRFIVLLAVSLLATTLYAREGKPVFTATRPVFSIEFTDTVPPPPAKDAPPVKTPEPDVKKNKPVVADAKIIKEVPKARKQIKPKVIPVTPVKPPKVIKPIIKKIGAILP